MTMYVIARTARRCPTLMHILRPGSARGMTMCDAKTYGCLGRSATNLSTWSASSPSTTRHASAARSGPSRCPVTSRPSSSRRQNVERSGVAKVASGTSWSSGWVV